VGPVFLFGTGRCGSTHLQRLVTLNTEVWVWGEHDGFLNPMLRGLAAYEGSPALKRAVFDAPLPEDDAALVERMRSETAILSWLNRINRDSLRNALREMIEKMFSAGVPRGWSGWGFKEILYGGPDDVPGLLLDMFPECRAAFSFREPAATMESMIRSWTPALARDIDKIGDIPKHYEYRARKWLMLMRYFVALKRARPDRIAILDTEALNAPAERVLHALRLPRRADLGGDTIPATNRGPRERADAAGQMMAACFEKWRDEMMDIYDEALALRDVAGR
jgi:hypothetical protein